MSNSARHKEMRRVRAKRKAKENRIYRNSGPRGHGGHGGGPDIDLGALMRFFRKMTPIDKLGRGR